MNNTWKLLNDYGDGFKLFKRENFKAYLNSCDSVYVFECHPDSNKYKNRVFIGNLKDFKE